MRLIVLSHIGVSNKILLLDTHRLGQLMVSLAAIERSIMLRQMLLLRLALIACLPNLPRLGSKPLHWVLALLDLHSWHGLLHLLLLQHGLRVGH